MKNRTLLGIACLALLGCSVHSWSETSVAQPLRPQLGTMETDFSARPFAVLQTPAPAPAPSLPTFLTPFRSYSGQFVIVSSKSFAAVVATPYATWPVKSFVLFGHVVTGVSINADLLAGAIFSGGQFTAGQSVDAHYSWHPNDFVGFGAAQLYSATKPIYRPFIEFGWQF